MQIVENVNLKKYNTFMLPSIAKFFCEIKSAWDLNQLRNLPEFQWDKVYFLGQWANTIFVNDFDWLVIKISITWKEIIAESDEDVLVKVWSGEIWEDFVLRCAEKKFVWMENLAYIPSSVWATAVQNIWAYWVEAKDIIYQLEWMNMQTWKIEILDRDDCTFWYRDSIFKWKLKDNFIITHVVYKLKKYKKWYQYNTQYAWILEKIMELWFELSDITPSDFVNVITEIRKSKLPDWKEIGTAWSFFKNPIVSTQTRDSLQQKYPELKWFQTPEWIKLSAWQLIDISGFKWKWNWKVWTYNRHALVLINQWDATGQDVVSFSTEIQEWVFQKFWVHLEPEVILVE